MSDDLISRLVSADTVLDMVISEQKSSSLKMVKA